MHTLRRAIAALFAVVLVVACVQGPRAPEVAPTGVLGLRGTPSELDDAGPLKVVHASPQGTLDGPSEITILFSKPMRALELADEERPLGVSITPPIPGRWRWVGTRAVTFVPEREGGGGSERLPRATRFEVLVPKGTKALDGEPLAEDFRFGFETERPRVVSTSPYQGSKGLKPDARFQLYTSAPVSDAELSRSVKLSAAGAPQRFTVTRPDPTDATRALLVPEKPLPLDAAIRLEVSEDLRTTEGPLPAGKGASYDFRTYGPLRVVGLSCDRYTPNKQCSAADSVQIELSNPVKVGALRRALRIEPQTALQLPEWLSDKDETTYFSLQARFVPGKSYRIGVRPPLVDVYGQGLVREHVETMVMDDLWPTARIGMSSGHVEAASKKEIAVASINAPDLSVGAMPLSEDDVLAMQTGELSSYAELAKRPGFKPRRAPQSPKNTVARTTVPLAEVLGGADARGPFAIAIRWTVSHEGRTSERDDRSVGQLTDLAISAKLSKHGSYVWVSRLGDVRPVANARVKIRRPGQPGVTKTTDAQGLARFEPSEFGFRHQDENAVVFVETDGDRAFAPVRDHVDAWEYDPGEDGLFGMIFDERGIYRPGDTVRIKGIVREPEAKGTRVPKSGRPVHLRVDGPDGEPLVERDVVLGPQGSFFVEARLPAQTRLGRHQIEASIDGERIAWGGFEVAEYRPAEFEIGAESDRPSYVRGDKATWTSRGAFLFGAPMSGAKADVVVSRARTWFSVPEHDGYEISDEPYHRDREEHEPRADVVEQHQISLDARGLATTNAPLTMKGQRGPESLSFHLDVTDLSRQVISTSTTAIVHPAEHYVGIELEDRFVDKGTTLAPRLLALSPRGDRVEGAAIDVELIKRSWAVAKQAAGVDAATTIATPVDTVAARCRVVSAKQPQSCALVPSEPGYYLVRARSEDRRKNPVAASLSVYVTGEGGSGSWWASDRSDVELITDKASYAVGETAKVLVKSPFKDAEAIVTVERATVHEQRRVQLSGAAPTLSIPITEDMRPNAFVSVLVLRGRSQPAPKALAGADVGAPGFRLGYVDLRVDPEAKRLGVQITPSKRDAGPGDELVVAVAVSDAAKRPVRSEVTLYAVDEGVLSLVGYQTPDPLAALGGPRPLRVATLESRARLASVFDPFSGLGLDKGLAGGGGGEGGGGSATPRRDFRASAYFNPSVLTGDDGRAEVRFKLPDTLTTWRVMAVAVAEDRYGSSAERVTTSRPLMARPALPRFLRAGDELDASLILSSKGLGDAQIDVKAALSGAVDLRGDAGRSVRLAKDASTELRFGVHAARVGQASFRFDIQGGGAKDSVVITRPVHSPAQLETVALDGATSSAAAEALGDLSSIRDDVGGLTITTASTALVGLDGGASQLIDYPYGCTEQLTSRLVPMLPMRELARDFGIALPANTDHVVETTIAKILSHQRADGSFGFWPDSPESNAWVTSYALWGLHEAKRRGVAVPQSSLDQAAQWLFRALASEDRSLRYGAGPFIVYVLAELGKPDPGRVSLLFEAREGMPLYGKALLLHAMVLGKHDPASIDALVRELEAAVRIDGPAARTAENQGDAYLAFLDSEARTSAMVLRALLAAKPQHPLAARLAIGLLQDRDGGAWRSTQETAWALLALSDYRRAQETAVPNFAAGIFFGETLLDQPEFRGRSLETRSTIVPTHQLRGASRTPLGFTVEGEGRLFYQARLRYAKRTLPTDSLDRGFYVDKKLRQVSTSSLEQALATVPAHTSARFAAGDLVLADLVLVNPSPRRFVVLDDPLPAGFEAVDTRLATTSSRFGGLDAPIESTQGERASGRAESYAYATREVRDDRVLFFVDHLPAGVFRFRYLARATSIGSYVVPPTRAELMYAPEVFGRNAAGNIVVAAEP